MVSPEDARQYLEEALRREGATLVAASLEVGRNRAYIQQYIRGGKPQYLSEETRAAIVRRWPSIDPERLRPPPRKSSAPSSNQQNQAQVHPPGYGKFVDDPRTLDLLEAWERIKKPELRDLVLRTALTMAEASDTLAA